MRQIDNQYRWRVSLSGCNNLDRGFGSQGYVKVKREPLLLISDLVKLRECPLEMLIKVMIQPIELEKDDFIVNVVATSMEKMTIVLTVLAVVHLNPNISSREIERQHGIPKSTFLRILKAQRYHAYYITLIQELTLRHFAQHEATFKNTGELNRHNCHYWSDVNLLWHRTVDNPHRWSLNAWCGIVNGYVIGPYFLNVCIDANGRQFEHILNGSK
ncbi:hypothetical protein TSAR_002541 [Trichomalopsis sarcophagae]|uniref:Uncharacterized protein n=1 Tax=Trichomalopsis sarcophagae TaxID=543379 RepID=A0A232EUQ3_9HYME|nr:hypothetical protein TSAR_002541 [Trichomalopsis sarcophagae]